METTIKLKILFIMSSLGGGGAEKALITLLNNFDYDRYDVDLALTSNTGIYLNEVPKQVRVLPIYSHPGTIIERVGFLLYSRFRVSCVERWATRLAIKLHYDTIVSFMQGRPLKFHTYIVDRAKKNISWVHADLYSSRATIGPVLSQSDEKRGYESMDEVVFVSKEAQTQFGKLGYSLKKSSVIYNPIPVDEIQKNLRKTFSKGTSPASEGGISIVLCGSLTSVKAFDRMVRVAERLIKEGLQFRINIIGDGPERNKLENLIDELGLKGTVNLLGFMRPPYAEMAKGDIFVSCSLTEAYPLNVCEAMCLCLPIVATECSGNSEVLRYGKYGLLVGQDENELYEAVKEMITNKYLRDEYAEKSKEGAKLFNMDKVMSEVYSVLCHEDSDLYQ